MTREALAHALVCSAALFLNACGGGGGYGGSSGPPQQTGIGPTGGTAQGPGGSQVSVPAGALTQNTAIAIAASNAGAPAQPTGMQLASQVYALTPHGTSFVTPVTVSFPFNLRSVPAGVTPVVYKTTAPQNGWEPVPGATVSNSQVSVQLSGFSWVVLAFVPPQITQQPQSLTVNEGASARFAATALVTALSAPPLTVQWQRSNDGGTTFASISGASTNTFELVTITGLDLATVASADNGARFRVIFSGPEGSSTSETATLTVTPAAGPPSITVEPQDRSVLVGTAATFSVAATGGASQFQWQRSGDGGLSFTDIAGATSGTFTLPNAQNADDNARFRVRVSNSIGNVVSRAATLRVRTSLLPGGGARISTGPGYSVARRADGEVFTWGTDSTFGFLGSDDADPDPDRSVPGPVADGPLVDLDNVVSVSASGFHTLALLANGEVWGWGGAAQGQLGERTSTSPFFYSPQPRRIQSVTNVTAVCAGIRHSLFLLADRTVLAMGDNIFGQLGNGNNTNSDVPVPVSGLQDVIAIACENHSLALLADGTVRAWGRNGFPGRPSAGALGDGTNIDRNAPVAVSALTGVAAIAAGSAYSMALMNDGTVRAWGVNFLSQLGTGDDTDTMLPVPPSATPGFTSITAIAAGDSTSLALRNDGRVFAWGNNELGQLGNGSIGGPVRVPAPITVLSDVVEIGRASDQVLVVTGDGTVWAWGGNNFGEVGNGQPSTTPVATPTRVTGLNLN